MFSYDALFSQAKFSKSRKTIRKVFKKLKTTDFEEGIRSLMSTAMIVDVYSDKQRKLTRMLKRDAKSLRKDLIRTIALCHPETPDDIDEEEYVNARAFLANFDRIYTVNYDLLLYWTVMQNLEPPVPRDDGFRESGSDTYVSWDPYNRFDTQRLFYLHDGLHFYDRGSELAKITWIRTGERLVDQIRRELKDGHFPLIVTEGTSKEKLKKILHHAYLNHAIRSFSGIGGTLFVFGHSLARNDAHILYRIVAGKISELFVGVFGNPVSNSNRNLRIRAEALADQREEMRREKPRLPELEVRFYDAASASVWSQL